MTFSVTPRASYKDLMRTHPEYDGVAWREMDIFYEGGKAVVEAARKPAAYGLPAKHQLLLQRYKEASELYKERLRRAVSLPYTGPVVDLFGAVIFSDTPSIEPNKDEEFWAEFADNVDAKGTNLEEFAYDLFTASATQQVSYILVDFPARPETAAVESQADEDKLGLRQGRLSLYKRPAVLDWQRDDNGNLTMAVVYSTKSMRPSLSGGHTFTRHEWRVCVEGAIWLFTFDQPEEMPEIQDNQMISGREVKTRYQGFPLVELAMPPGLWIGAKLWAAERELFNKQNALSWAEWQTAYSRPWAKVRDRQAFSKMSDHGMWAVLELDESIGWSENSGNACTTLTETLERQKGEMYRTVIQLPMSAPMSQGRQRESGDAKRRDRDPMNRVAGIYGSRIWEAILKAVQLIANGRAPSGVDEQFNVETRGLREFDERRIEVILKLFSEDAFEKLGPTAQANLHKEVARFLLGQLSQEEIEKIFTEIEKASAEHADAVRKMRAQLMTAGQESGDEDDDDQADEKDNGKAGVKGKKPIGVPGRMQT